MYKDVRYLVAGDSAIIMEFGNEISEEINARIRSTIDKIEAEKISGIIELVPTYRSITISYNPLVIKYEELMGKLKSFEAFDSDSVEEKVKLIEIPTVYAGEYGPDISFVAENSGLSKEEVIKIHTGTDYLVYMLGFAPGFTYLGGMDKRIETPRLKTPRLKIPGGSVGIAGAQTGMYPSESPGGWQLIGRTPLKLYDEKNDPPVFINAGDYIRYVQIDEAEFNRIKELVEKDEYEVSIKTVDRGELNG
ncbi:sensor histidine kinase inhibitor, KipI family [Anaerosphaera aminiphila DSM 21120]|uniref:Sensor histidine kinase inhibitor, KipI family n=1 Tax=Anaerosphaera aminiphila DSM 21120 TaxID=1120995 RepID=A0A1M5QCG0_9FIRM|nr:5-oxoprolinase subunit PxpB [Anaerosphaera aminiphila]SHH11884.1 sensor histidine kinase inhibitor, KipI family [Anaerosphaera aminiphila DSM 21120]